MEINLRRAEKSDIEFLFNLRNQDSVRSAFWNTEKVEPDAHKNWVISSLQNSKRILYVIEADGKPAGQIRFDITDESGKTAEVSISVSENFRGKGIGGNALVKADNLLFRDFSDIGKLIAHIKTDNQASVGTFIKAGYLNLGTVNYEDHECIEMILTR